MSESIEEGLYSIFLNKEIMSKGGREGKETLGELEI